MGRFTLSDGLSFGVIVDRWKKFEFFKWLVYIYLEGTDKFYTRIIPSDITVRNSKQADHQKTPKNLNDKIQQKPQLKTLEWKLWSCRVKAYGLS